MPRRPTPLLLLIFLLPVGGGSGWARVPEARLDLLAAARDQLRSYIQ